MELAVYVVSTISSGHRSFFLFLYWKIEKTRVRTSLIFVFLSTAPSCHILFSFVMALLTTCNRLYISHSYPLLLSTWLFRYVKWSTTSTRDILFVWFVVIRAIYYNHLVLEWLISWLYSWLTISNFSSKVSHLFHFWCDKGSIIRISQTF